MIERTAGGYYDIHQFPFDEFDDDPLVPVAMIQAGNDRESRGTSRP
ncbi:MAG: hypothetical protein MZV65_30000 [Chromatiales bacterium]|nr:hypothetical protein [Chromatiales bacterium]